MKNVPMTIGFLMALAACGSSSAGGSTTGTGGGAAVSPTCLDASNQPTATCAVTPKGDVCAMGDANTCTPITKLEVTADDGKTGVCMHLVFANNCSSEIFADTCIEQNTNGTLGWQCFTSSVISGAGIDVSACHATGNYFFVSTTSSGQLDIDEQKCPAPTP